MNAATQRGDEFEGLLVTSCCFRLKSSTGGKVSSEATWMPPPFLRRCTEWISDVDEIE